MARLSFAGIVVTAWLAAIGLQVLCAVEAVENVSDVLDDVLEDEQDSMTHDNTTNMSNDELDDEAVSDEEDIGVDELEDFEDGLQDSIPNEDEEVADLFANVLTPMTISLANGKLHVMMRQADGNEELFVLEFGFARELDSEGHVVHGRSLSIAHASRQEEAIFTSEVGVVSGAKALIARLFLPLATDDSCEEESTSRNDTSGKGPSIQVSSGKGSSGKGSSGTEASGEGSSETGSSGKGSSGKGSSGKVSSRKEASDKESSSKASSGKGSSGKGSIGKGSSEKGSSGKGSSGKGSSGKGSSQKGSSGKGSSGKGSSGKGSGHWAPAIKEMELDANSSSYFALEAFVFLEDAVLEYGDDVVEVNAGEMKFNIESAEWPFCGDDHVLRVDLGMKLHGENHTAKHFGDADGDDDEDSETRWAQGSGKSGRSAQSSKKSDHEGKSGKSDSKRGSNSGRRGKDGKAGKGGKGRARGKMLIADAGFDEVFLSMPTVAIIDDNETDCSVGLEERGSSLRLFFEFPYFEETLFYDPVGGSTTFDFDAWQAALEVERFPVSEAEGGSSTTTAAETGLRTGFAEDGDLDDVTNGAALVGRFGAALSVTVAAASALVVRSSM